MSYSGEYQTSTSGSVNVVGPNDELEVDSSGNCGIGVTGTIGGKLQVDGTLLVGDTHEIPGSSPWTVSNTQMILGGSYNADFNTGTKVKLLITSYDNDGASIYPIVCIDENNQDDFYLKNAPSQSGTPRAYFRGQVGIGSSATSGKLNLYQTFSTPSLNGTVSTNNNAGINFYTGQTSWWSGGVYSTGITPTVGARIWHNPATYSEVGSGNAGHHGRLYLSCGWDAATSDDTGICIESTGMVGIGYNATSVKLSVNGQTYSSSGYLSSDDRIKYNEEVIDTSLALNLINQLNPQKYEKIIEEPSNAEGTWIPTDQEWEIEKDETTVGTNGDEIRKWKYVIEAGMIAQDIRQIPELAFCVNGDEINENGKQEPLRLDYNNINAYHISATKELTTLLNALITRVDVLETANTDMMAEIAILQSV